MGSPLSGSNRPRGGKRSIDSLPVVQLTRRAAGGLVQKAGPLLRLEELECASVHYGARKWAIAIQTTALHFGGHRRWLVCPRCSRRCQALYIGDVMLACRVCLRLRYASQHESERDRMFRRAHKLRDRLGWPGGVAEGGRGRPGGMRKSTYVRLCTELSNLTAALLLDIEKWIYRAEATLA
jgi:hypothetical protein